MTCIVEPGIILDELNRFLKPFGLWFPVDVSTSSRATIGGMAGNNSCGGRSIRYGMMRDNVLEIEAILFDGSTYNFGKIENNHVNLSNGVAPKIISDLLKLAKDNQKEILSKFPKVLRRVGGYNIDALLPDAMANRPNGKVGDGINVIGKQWPKRESNWKAGKELKRIRPDEISVNIKSIQKSLSDAVKDSAFPGGVLLASKDGKIFIHEAFGHHTYDKKEKVKKSDMDYIVNLNLKACFNIAQICTKKMLQSKNRKKIGGSIINMSSQMGKVGGPIRSVYNMTKFGIEGLTKGMAIDLAKSNIRVNSVCPTFVLTPMVKRFFKNKKFMREMIRNIPLGRVAEQSDVATSVAFLASDSSSMITGSSIMVDGGWTAQ